MPLQLSGVGIECYDRTRIKVVAGPWISIPIRAGIACAPVNKVEIGIVACWRPDRTSAVLPRIAAPGRMAGFAWFGDDVEAPFLIAVLCIECGDITADAVLASGRTKNDFVFD